MFKLIFVSNVIPKSLSISGVKTDASLRDHDQYLRGVSLFVPSQSVTGADYVIF